MREVVNKPFLKTSEPNLFYLLRNMLIRFLWPTLVWTLFILILTLIPGSSLPSVSFFQIDKLVHIFFFSVLMILSSYSFNRLKGNRHFQLNYLLVAFLYCMCLGVLIEVLQLLVPGRDFSLADIIANMIGAAIGYLIYKVLQEQRWLKR